MASNMSTKMVSTTGVYSAKSAYQAFFAGRTKAMAAAELGKAGAPLSHKLHMWFAIKDRLWKAGRLERQGMDHLSQCSLCCQEQETSMHITV
jgi:hypothetical protein